MKRLSLVGKWSFKATDENNYYDALVPGCQFLDLMRNGIIPDPFLSTNEKTAQWVHEKDYVYRKTFLLSKADLEYADLELVCVQLDTICELKLNGEVIGNAENCHREYRFSLNDKAREGENILEITFFSPKKYVEEKRKIIPTPINSNGQNGIVHIRKPQCHFGWDWGPVLTPVGISGDIFIELSNVKLGELTVKAKKTVNAFKITAIAENAEEIVLTHPDGRTLVIKGENAEFEVNDPELWWTKELSQKAKQPLYVVTARRNDEDCEELKTKKIGLRTIELNREKDEYGYNFQFVLNGVPIFVKGANYVPPDSFITRFTKDKLSALLDAAEFSNFNMLRIWGGGYYASEELLSACDERGILVWQDFAFACQAYPFFETDFLENVLKEVEYNVKRISSHPSLALWCGNNEIEDMHMAWVTMKKYVDWTETFFYKVLPKQIALFDDVTPYTQGSPIGSSHNQDVGADHVGDTHLWGVWHGLQPMKHYRKRMTRFCSEFGFESLPSMQAIRSYATPEEYPLSSETQKSHQKCKNGNDKMLYYIASRFKLSDKIEELVYLSQVTQQECIADATEHWRRNKGRCNGAMYWQFNDCWQTCSWSSIDYLGVYKALQYKAKEFNDPLTLSIEDEKDKLKIYILNDLLDEQTVEIEFVTFDFYSILKVERIPLTVKPLENLFVGEFSFDVDRKKGGVAVRLYRNGVRLTQKTHLFYPEKKLKLPKPDFTVSETITGNLREITISSPNYQRLVALENESTLPFSDNFFDLLPGESKTVYQKINTTRESATETYSSTLSEKTNSNDTIILSDLKHSRNIPYDNQMSDNMDYTLTIRSVASTSRASFIKTCKAKFKVFFSITNLANAFYHGRVKKS
ncbi:MAG: glycoside hydrolase family 2 protein [Clostridia bacterium]|nr:glycoside hydrolase family 2 protein [Clostridia bacterium]